MPLACTRPNPAFEIGDEAEASEATTEDVPDEGEGDTTGEDAESTDSSTDASESEAEAESDTMTEPDLPEDLVCEFEPNDGLALIAINSSFAIDINCPAELNRFGAIASVDGGALRINTCSPGCFECSDESFELTTFPLVLTEHVPAQPSKCLYFELSNPVFKDGTACHWGAMSVFSGDPDSTPYVIATSHAFGPTAKGADVLGEKIPAYEKAGSCNCDSINAGDDCCYNSQDPPSFFTYPWNGQRLYPGDAGALQLQFAPEYKFEIFQAQHIHSCERPDAEISWAVRALL